MYKTRQIDIFGGQMGNEEKFEDVTVTEEKIIGEDGVERTIIKKTTTRRTVVTQQAAQGGKVTTVKRLIYPSDGKEIKELPEQFREYMTFDRKFIEAKKDASSSSSSSDDEDITQKIKSFFGGNKKSPKDGKSEKLLAIQSFNSPPVSPSKFSTNKEPATRITNDDKEFAEDCLQWHNYYRKIHGVKPLKLSAELNEFAKEWVQQLARRDVMQHRPNNVHGENIFMKWSSDPNYKISGRDPAENWYSEIKDHVFNREPYSLRSGHFTQVVWKGSEEFGVAKAKSRSGKILVVANYSPAGNMIGHFASNVPPPK